MLRDTRIDSIKFFLMICVIIGHMLYCDLNGKWNYKLFEFIYSFHMPAFVLLSGYCFKKKPGMGGGKRYCKFVGCIYYISNFVLWSTCWTR